MRIPDRRKKARSWTWAAGAGVATVLAVALAVWLAAAPPWRAEAHTTVFVDDDACPGPGTGSSADPYCSIQDAIDHLESHSGAGGLIVIRAGTYNTAAEGPFPLDVDHAGFTMEGDSAAARPAIVIIPDSGTAFDVGTTDTGADGVTIRHMVIDGVNAGGAQDGIFVDENTDGHTFADLEILHWGRDGIHFEDPGGAAGSDNNDILNNWIHDNGEDGVHLHDGSGNTVSTSQINSNGGDGVEAGEETNLAVTGNDIFSNNDNGIALSGTSGTTIDGNAGIFNNGGDGVNAGGDSDLVVTDNDLTANGDDQLELSGVTGADVLRNDFVAGSDAIQIDGASTDILLGGSASDRNRFRGIPSSAVCDNQAVDDCYVELDTDISVNATHNDWGSTDLSQIEDWVCHLTEAGCQGAVNFSDPEPPGGSPIQLTTPTPTASQTPSTTSTPTPTTTATPSATQAVTLVTGCQIKTFSPYYAKNVALSTVAADISGADFRFWFQMPGSNAFDLFDPKSAERSTVTTLTEEAGFICADGPATWDRPAA